MKKTHFFPSKLTAITRLFCITFLLSFTSLAPAQNESGNNHANNSLSFIIPEILELKDGEVISKEILENYDTRSIAESIVRRLRIKDEKQKPLAGSFDYDLMAETKLQYFFDIDILNLNILIVELFV